MLLPLGTDRAIRTPTVTTYVLLGLNLVVFFVMMIMNQNQMASSPSPNLWQQLWTNRGGSMSEPVQNFYEALWLWKGDWLSRPWSLASYAFLHGSGLHLLGNMAALWVFGPNVEDRFGRWWFLLFYLGSGSLAGFAHIATSQMPVVGASGAIAGVTGAYLVLFPRTSVRCFVLFFYIGIFWIPALWFICAAIALDVYSVFKASRLTAGGIVFTDSVAHLAHLAGYATGTAVSMILLLLRKDLREPFDLFMTGRQAMRRRQFKSAAQEHERMRADALTRAQDPDAEHIAKSRAEISTAISLGRLDDAAALYRILADRFANKSGACTLARNHLYELGTHLYMSEDMAGAAFVFEQFLAAYRTDAEAPQVCLLLGRINARHLNDPVRARALLLQALERLRTDSDVELAQRELASLG